MIGLQERFYRNWAPDPADEISEDETRGLNAHARALFTESGELVRLELYNDGNLVQVNYYDAAVDVVRTNHLREYPGIDFVITWKNALIVDPFHWEFTQSFSGSGELARTATHLCDGSDREIMNIERRPRGEILTITKFFYDSSNNIVFIFEYDSDGGNVIVHDTDDGDEVFIEDVLPSLPDQDFYSHGYKLPRGLTESRIPSPAEILNQER